MQYYFFFQHCMHSDFVVILPFNPIDVCHSRHLEEGYDEQGQRPYVGVEDLQPVVPRAQGEDQGRSKAEQTYQTYKQQGRGTVLHGFNHIANPNQVFGYDLVGWTTSNVGQARPGIDLED